MEEFVMGYKILKGAMVGILLGVCGGILLTSVLHIAGGGSVRDVVSLFRYLQVRKLAMKIRQILKLCLEIAVKQRVCQAMWMMLQKKAVSVRMSMRMR